MKIPVVYLMLFVWTASIFDHCLRLTYGAQAEPVYDSMG